MSKTTLKNLLEVLPEGYRVDAIPPDTAYPAEPSMLCTRQLASRALSTREPRPLRRALPPTPLQKTANNARSITIYAGDTTVEEDYPGLLETEVLGVEPIESDERLDAYLAD